MLRLLLLLLCLAASTGAASLQLTTAAQRVYMDAKEHARRESLRDRALEQRRELLRVPEEVGLADGELARQRLEIRRPPLRQPRDVLRR